MIVRTGDIDNFGIGWPAGFDPGTRERAPPRTHLPFKPLARRSPWMGPTGSWAPMKPTRDRIQGHDRRLYAQHEAAGQQPAPGRAAVRAGRHGPESGAVAHVRGRLPGVAPQGAPSRLRSTANARRSSNRWSTPSRRRAPSARSSAWSSCRIPPAAVDLDTEHLDRRPDDRSRRRLRPRLRWFADQPAAAPKRGNGAREGDRRADGTAPGSGRRVGRRRQGRRHRPGSGILAVQRRPAWSSSSGRPRWAAINRGRRPRTSYPGEYALLNIKLEPSKKETAANITEALDTRGRAILYGIHFDSNSAYPVPSRPRRSRRSSRCPRTGPRSDWSSKATPIRRTPRSSTRSCPRTGRSPSWTGW